MKKEGWFTVVFAIGYSALRMELHAIRRCGLDVVAEKSFATTAERRVQLNGAETNSASRGPALITKDL